MTEEWQAMRLASLSTIVGRGIAPKYDDDGTTLVLNQRCIRDGRIDFAAARRHSTAERRISPEKYLREGDVLINSTGAGTLGRTAGVRSPIEHTTVDTHLTIVRPNADVDPRWLAFALGLAEPAIEALAEGSTGQTELSRHQLANIELTTPPVGDQRAIAEVLSALENKIAANSQLALTAERLAMAYLSEVRTMVPLRDAARLHRNQVSPESIDEAFVDHFSLPAFDLDVMPSLTSPNDIKSAKFRLDRPVVLLSKLNPRFPRVWNVERLGGRPALASTEFLVLEPLNSTTAVLWAALTQPNFSAALDAKASGTSGSHQRVKPEDALSTLIVDPSAIGRDRSVLVTSVVTLAGMARSENRKLAAIESTLLPHLMSGTLRVKDVESRLKGML